MSTTKILTIKGDREALRNTDIRGKKCMDYIYGYYKIEVSEEEFEEVMAWYCADNGRGKVIGVHVDESTT